MNGRLRILFDDGRSDEVGLGIVLGDDLTMNQKLVNALLRSAQYTLHSKGFAELGGLDIVPRP